MPASSSNKQFVLDNVTFKKYQAGDSHGCGVTHYYVDGKLVNDRAFRHALQSCIRKTGLQHEMLIAVGAYYVSADDWTKSY